MRRLAAAPPRATVTFSLSTIPVMPPPKASVGSATKATMTPQQKAALTRKLRAQEKAEKTQLDEEAQKKASEPPTVWQDPTAKKTAPKRERAGSDATALPNQVPTKKRKAATSRRKPVTLGDDEPDEHIIQEESPDEDFPSKVDGPPDGALDIRTNRPELQDDVTARDCAMDADNASEFVASDESVDSEGSVEADEFVTEIQQPELEVQASRKSKTVAKKLAQGIPRFADEDAVASDEHPRRRRTHVDLTATDSDDDGNNPPALRPAHSKPMPAPINKPPAPRTAHQTLGSTATVSRSSKTPTKGRRDKVHDKTVTPVTSRLLMQRKRDPSTAPIAQHDSDGEPGDNAEAGNDDIDNNGDVFFDESSAAPIGFVLACDATVKPQDRKTVHPLTASVRHIKSETDDEVRPEHTIAHNNVVYTDYVLNRKGSINITAQNPKLRTVLHHAIQANLPKVLFFKNAFPGADERYLLVDALIDSANEHNLSEITTRLRDDRVYALKLSEAPRNRVSNIRGEIYHDDVRGFVFSAYKLDQFKTPGTIAVAVSSLIKDNAYIFPGAFTNGIWKPNHTLPFCNDALIELANKLWFSEVPRHTFPSELFANKMGGAPDGEDEDEEMVEYRLPRAMVAFLAAAIHAALHEWLEGSQTPLSNGFNGLED
ncbi:hypothetical protein OF83DRAFT_1178598 [Amylostereum chailletii]|nr:hypothetical protein OF83DRAFT_1178598 [Amylostereum chailletii]